MITPSQIVFIEAINKLIPISLIGALLVFLVNTWQERLAVRSAIICDMNYTLRRARETYEYLKSEDHYWLQANSILTRAPSDIASTSGIFNGVLPKLYLLGPSAVSRVLAFYTHFHYCEGLKSSLFNHIDNHVKSKQPITESDVFLLRLRRDRICSGLLSLTNVCNGKQITALRRLPLEYSIPPTVVVAANVNKSLSDKEKRIYLP